MLVGKLVSRFLRSVLVLRRGDLEFVQGHNGCLRKATELLLPVLVDGSPVEGRLGLEAVQRGLVFIIVVVILGRLLAARKEGLRGGDRRLIEGRRRPRRQSVLTRSERLH